MRHSIKSISLIKQQKYSNLFSNQQSLTFIHYLLAITLSFVLASINMFLITFITIFHQSSIYYETNKSNMIYLMKIASMSYIIVMPIMSIFVRNRVQYNAMIIGILGLILVNICRCIWHRDYQSIKIITVIGSIMHVPVMTGIYKLINIFPKNSIQYIGNLIHTISAIPTLLLILFQAQFINYMYPIQIRILQIDKYIDATIYGIALFSIISILVLSGFLIYLKANVKELFRQRKVGQSIVQYSKVVTDQIDQVTQIASPTIIKKRKLQQENKNVLDCLTYWEQLCQIKDKAFFFIQMVVFAMFFGLYISISNNYGIYLSRTNIRSRVNIGMAGFYSQIVAVICSLIWRGLPKYFNQSPINFTLKLLLFGLFSMILLQIYTLQFSFPLIKSQLFLYLSLCSQRFFFTLLLYLMQYQLSKGASIKIIRTFYYSIGHGMNLLLIWVFTLQKQNFIFQAQGLIAWICISLGYFILYCADPVRINKNRAIKQSIPQEQPEDQIENEQQNQDAIDNWEVENNKQTIYNLDNKEYQQRQRIKLKIQSLRRII